MICKKETIFQAMAKKEKEMNKHAKMNAASLNNERRVS